MKAYIRKDLLEEGLLIPIGNDSHYCDKEPLEYRFLSKNDAVEQFQVFYNNEWQNAYSIDFEF